jgi:hypothetical protein
MDSDKNTAILVPIEMEEFWLQIRFLLREEISALNSKKNSAEKPIVEPGLLQKPFYDIKEIRQLFNNVSRTTIYEWMRIGKLKPKKMRGKIYFLWMDIEKILRE